MIPEHIELTLRHKFRGGWAYMNPTRFLCVLKLTPGVVTYLTDTEGYDAVHFVRLPRGKDWRLLARGIRDTLSGSGCMHEHDCCGCASTSVSVDYLGPRRLRITRHVRYNY